MQFSPFLRLELFFLKEIGRLKVAPDNLLGGITGRLGAMPSSEGVGEVAEIATSIGWTRDPFDRLIVATAMLHGAVLITRDRRISAHFDGAVW